jgi:hypothetical protein
MIMVMRLKCPKCNNEFDIEESHQANLKLEKAIQEAANETQRLLKEQEEQQESKLAAALEAQIEKERKTLKEKAIQEAAKETQRLLKEQEEQQESKLAAALEAGIEKKAKYFKQEVNEKIIEAERLKDEEIEKIKAEKKYIEDKHLKDITEVKQKLQRNQNVQIVGEAAERRLKESLELRFTIDVIDDVPTGTQGADIELHVKQKKDDDSSIGMILIERKSTSTFQNTWIKKLGKNMEANGAKIGVIVTDVMPKKESNSGYFQPKNNISVLRTDMALEGIDLIRKGMISDYNNESRSSAGKDIELTTNVFSFVTGEGKDYLEELADNIKEKHLLIKSQEREHTARMKKEWQNLEDQVQSFKKFGEGLKEASEQRFTLLSPEID